MWHDTPCDLWQGYKDRHGYARKGQGLGHRVVYEARFGPIPPGLELDHLCKNKNCINPLHLEPVTRLENMRRRYATYTHCKNGHEYTPENTYRRANGNRDCRACINARARKYRQPKAKEVPA